MNITREALSIFGWGVTILAWMLVTVAFMVLRRNRRRSHNPISLRSILFILCLAIVLDVFVVHVLIGISNSTVGYSISLVTLALEGRDQLTAAMQASAIVRISVWITVFIALSFVVGLLARSIAGIHRLFVE